MLSGIVSTALGIVLQVREEALIRGLRGHLPFCLDRRQRVLRGESIWSDQSDKIAVAHNLHAVKLSRGAGVEGNESRVETIRTKHCAKHHLRQGHVRGILVFPGHKVAPVGFGNRNSSTLPLRSSRERSEERRVGKEC